MNDLLRRAVKRAQIPATKEPANLILQKWETPRWQHIYPTVQGQANGLGCQCPSTYAESHTGDTAREANAAANQAAANEIAKYDALASMHIFYPVAIETEGTWNHWDVELVQKIGRQATSITGETR